MDVDQLRAEVRDFLITRRGRITPAEVGPPVYGGLWGVSGLRREELAMLAGLSVEYYSQLERGNLRGVSEAVLESASRTAEDMPEALSGDHSSCEVAGPPRGV